MSNKEETVIEEVDLKEKKEKFTKKKVFTKIFSTLLVVSFAVYALFTLVYQQIQINEAQSDLDQLYKEIQIIETNAEELKKIANSDKEENEKYIENLARNQYGYAKEGERIFINIAG